MTGRVAGVVMWAMTACAVGACDKPAADKPTATATNSQAVAPAARPAEVPQAGQRWRLGLQDLRELPVFELYEEARGYADAIALKDKAKLRSLFAKATLTKAGRKVVVTSVQDGGEICKVGTPYEVKETPAVEGWILCNMLQRH